MVLQSTTLKRGDHVSQPKPRKRRSYKDTLAGSMQRTQHFCVQCRLDNSDCDEIQPACTRCTSAGRRCDYLSPINSGSDVGELKPLPATSTLLSASENKVIRDFFASFGEPPPDSPQPPLPYQTCSEPATFDTVETSGPSTQIASVLGNLEVEDLAASESLFKLSKNTWNSSSASTSDYPRALETDSQHDLSADPRKPVTGGVCLSSSPANAHQAQLEPANHTYITAPSINTSRTNELLPSQSTTFPPLQPDDVRLLGIQTLSIGTWSKYSSSDTDLIVSYSTDPPRLLYSIESHCLAYQVVIPFYLIKNISWRLGGTAVIVDIEITEPPFFYAYGPSGDCKLSDFTDDLQGSKVPVHRLRGSSYALVEQLRILRSLPSFYKHRPQESGPFPDPQLPTATSPAHDVKATESEPEAAANKAKHVCPYCSTAFTRRHNLQSHLLTHSQEKPYVCATCQSRFRRLHDLKRHVKLHTGEMPHECPTCSRRFARTDALARHTQSCRSRRASFGGYDKADPNDEDSTVGVTYDEPKGMPQTGDFRLFQRGRQSSVSTERTLDVPVAHCPTDSGYDSLPLGASKIFMASMSDDRLGLDDAKTIYSDGASVETVERDSFVDRLAELLKHGLKDIDPDDITTYGVLDDIKDCLADFALRLGLESTSPSLRRAMAFIHKYRALVGGSFEDQLRQVPDEQEGEDRGSADGMPLEELMSRWFNKETTETPVTVPEEIAVPEDALQISDLTLHNNLSELDSYSKLLLSSESYQWLTCKLKNKALLTYDNNNTCRAIRDQVVAAIPKELIVQVGRASRVVRATFLIEWSLEDFLRDQLSPTSDPFTVGNILSLTGSPPDIQAMTCSDYLQQTWPTTGLHLITAIEEALRTSSRISEVRRPDGADLVIVLHGFLCAVSVGGTRDMVAEVAEQVSWLSGVLRTSRDKNRTRAFSRAQASLGKSGMTICTPAMESLGKASGIEELQVALDQIFHSRAKIPPTSQDGDIQSKLVRVLGRFCGTRDEIHIFDSTFTFSPVDMDSLGGNCWQHLLPRCTIVKGFPIRRRPKVGLGMEIPLTIMAGLVGTNRVNQYRDSVYIRGYSAIYSPSEIIDDTLAWHLTCNQTGGRISYRDVPKDVHHVNFADVEGKRHLVGWCAWVTNRIGTDSIPGSVAESQLPGTQSGCVLDKFVLTFPKEIAYGPSFALLPSQKSRHLASATYRAKLQYLKDHFALFWDTEDDRGWLTNCLAAFLHLVRSTFVPYDELTRVKLMTLWTNLQAVAQSVLHPDDPLKARSYSSSSWIPVNAASDSPANEEYSAVAKVAGEIFTRVCDQLFEGIDKLITFQEQVERDDFGTANRTLRLLEGWSFPDLVSELGSKRAKVMSLPTVAFSWARLLRSLGAITIFGERFRDLLSPGETCLQMGTNVGSEHSTRVACRALPSGNFLVAVSMRDVRGKIRKLKHCPETILIGESAMLPKFRSAFANCGRQLRRDLCACESHTSILMPWPVAHRQSLPTSAARQCGKFVDADDFVEGYIDGAIIFGHDDQLGYYLDETGNPVKGEPPDPAAEQEKAFNDSGFGTDSSRVSHENAVSRITTRSTEEVSAQDSGIFPKDSTQSYKDSVVHGGAPVYGNVYVTNHHNNMVAASQTSFLGIHGTSSSNSRQQLSLPALASWTSHASSQNYLEAPPSLNQQFESSRGSQRPSSNESDAISPPTKRRRLVHPVAEQQPAPGRQTVSASPEIRDSNESQQIVDSLGLLQYDNVKRCCRCHTAMSVEKPTAECEECVHEFCMNCGILTR